MSIRRLLGPVAMVCAFASMSPALAGEPDTNIQVQLENLGLKYKVDDDGDFRLVNEAEDGRSQIVWVRSITYTYKNQTIREIWSPGYRSKGKSFSGKIANRLLEASNDLKLGAWVKQGKTAMFVIKIAADADAEGLRQAILAATLTADQMEQELTHKDDY